VIQREAQGGLAVLEKTNKMNLIIPMAGRGTRLRPQTLTTPKPLIEVAGKTILQRIIDIALNGQTNNIENIGFIIQDKDPEVEILLKSIGQKNKINISIFYQSEAKGTADAIFCAKELLCGSCLIVFADTLFDANLKFDKTCEAAIFVQEVEDPSAYGVIKCNKDNIVQEFIEKPTNFISNLAIIGVYYFKSGLELSNELKSILDNNILDKGEYQITTALENLKNKGMQFMAHKTSDWLDFGSPQNLLDSHKFILNKEQPSINSKRYKNTTIHPPCKIAKGVIIENSVIGPHVSIAKGSTVKSSVIKNTIIQSSSKVYNSNLNNSIIGKNVVFNQNFQSVNIGDYSIIQ
jgi:glucose-1-phosphate thymidylyltransferase